VIVIS
jgi:hypothetical protein